MYDEKTYLWLKDCVQDVIERLLDRLNDPDNFPEYIDELGVEITDNEQIHGSWYNSLDPAIQEIKDYFRFWRKFAINERFDYSMGLFGEELFLDTEHWHLMAMIALYDYIYGAICQKFGWDSLIGKAHPDISDWKPKLTEMLENLNLEQIQDMFS